MKIDKLEIKDSQVNFADNIDNVIYNSSLNVNEEQFEEIKRSINALASETQIELKKYLEKFEQLDSHERIKVAEKIRTFLINNGIPIAQNLTASAIFEIVKYLFAI